MSWIGLRICQSEVTNSPDRRGAVHLFPLGEPLESRAAWRSGFLRENRGKEILVVAGQQDIRLDPGREGRLIDRLGVSRLPFQWLPYAPRGLSLNHEVRDLHKRAFLDWVCNTEYGTPLESDHAQRKGALAVRWIVSEFPRCQYGVADRGAIKGFQQLFKWAKDA